MSTSETATHFANYAPAKSAVTAASFFAKLGIAAGASFLVVVMPVSSSKGEPFFVGNSGSRVTTYTRELSAFEVSAVDYILMRLDQLLAQHPALKEQVADARAFSVKLPAAIKPPLVWSDEDLEVALEWIKGELHAIVTFEGDGEIGYAMRDKDKFVPGQISGHANAGPPADLLRYIIRL